MVLVRVLDALQEPVIPDAAVQVLLDGADDADPDFSNRVEANHMGRCLFLVICTCFSSKSLCHFNSFHVSM